MRHSITLAAVLAATNLCTDASASATRVEACLKARNCAFHLVGVATREPYLQLAVIATEARKWSGADWDAAVSAARQKGLWAKAYPREAMVELDGMPVNAPFFPKAVANVGQRLTSFSTGVSQVRQSKVPRAGVPGWDAKNEPSRDKLPL